MTATAVMSLATESEATVAAAALMKTELIVTGTHTATVEEAPPPPYTTVTLLEDATTRLKWDASKVMAIAQSLFEGIELGGTEHRSGAHAGLITYHRTDSSHVAPEAQVEARAVIAHLYGQVALPPRSLTGDNRQPTPNAGSLGSDKGRDWFGGLFARLRRSKNGNERVDNSNRKQTEAHEAIRPTLAARLPETVRPNLDDDQLSLYQLIWERFIASQMRAARYRVITVDLEGESEP